MPLTDDVMKVDMIGDIDNSDEIVQAYQFQLISGGIDNDLTLDDLLELLTLVWAVVDGLINIRTVFRRIRVSNLTQDTILGDRVFSPVLAGAVDGEAVPNQVTAPVSFKTDVPRVILRKHLGTLSKPSLTADGFITAGAQAFMALYGVAMLADHVMTNGTYIYGYLSPKTLGFEVPTTAFFTAVTGTQRRRRVGVGS